MKLLALVQTQLRIDAPLPWNVRDASAKLLLAKGQMLAGKAQRDALLERGVYVDAEEALAAAAAAAAQAQRQPSLFGLWERAIWQLERVLRSVAEPGFGTRVDEFAGELTGLVDRDPDIAIYRAVRQDQKRFPIYGRTHALHTATLGLLMGRRLGWDDERTRRLVRAALTMNLSILNLQGRLAAQGVPPTESQRAMLREHPRASAQQLRDAGIEDDHWLTMVEQHHERPDGSGYPRRLRTVVDDALALRHADVFTAKISPRANRAALPTQQAARELFADDDGGPLAGALIKEFGIYPPGDFVKLRSGELAVVIRRGANAEGAVGGEHHQPQRRADREYAAARHRESRIRDRRAGVRQAPGVARAAGAAVRHSGVARQAARPCAATAAAAFAAASASPR